MEKKPKKEPKRPYPGIKEPRPDIIYGHNSDVMPEKLPARNGIQFPDTNGLWADIR